MRSCDGVSVRPAGFEPSSCRRTDRVRGQAPAASTPCPGRWCREDGAGLVPGRDPRGGMSAGSHGARGLGDGARARPAGLAPTSCRRRSASTPCLGPGRCSRGGRAAARPAHGAWGVSSANACDAPVKPIGGGRGGLARCLLFMVCSIACRRSRAKAKAGASAASSPAWLPSPSRAVRRSAASRCCYPRGRRRRRCACW